MNLIKEAVLLEEQKEYKKIYDGQGGEKFYKMTFETFYDGMIISKN